MMETKENITEEKNKEKHVSADTCTRWGIYEVALYGPKEGNPFTEQHITGTFHGTNETVLCDGFYDGDGIYRIRFMPSFEGEYTYQIQTTFGKECEGHFTVTKKAKGGSSWTSARCKYLSYGLRGWHAILFNRNDLLRVGVTER